VEHIINTLNSASDSVVKHSDGLGAKWKSATPSEQDNLLMALRRIDLLVDFLKLEIQWGVDEGKNP